MFTCPTLCLESPQALLTGRADVYMADALPRVTAGTADRKGRCLHGRTLPRVTTGTADRKGICLHG